MNYDDLLPAESPESRPFWEGLRKEKLLIQKCSNCGKLRHYPRPLCDSCYSFDFDWIESSGKGIIHSWVVNHHPFHPAFSTKTPYTTVTADMEEGVRLLAPLVSAIADINLKLGETVHVGFTKINSTFTYPHFELESD